MTQLVFRSNNDNNKDPCTCNGRALFESHVSDMLGQAARTPAVLEGTLMQVPWRLVRVSLEVDRGRSSGFEKVR